MMTTTWRCRRCASRCHPAAGARQSALRARAGAAGRPALRETPQPSTPEPRGWGALPRATGLQHAPATHTPQERPLPRPSSTTATPRIRSYLLVALDGPRLLVLRTSDWSRARALYGLHVAQFHNHAGAPRVCHRCEGRRLSARLRPAHAPRVRTHGPARAAHEQAAQLSGGTRSGIALCRRPPPAPTLRAHVRSRVAPRLGLCVRVRGGRGRAHLPRGDRQGGAPIH